MANGDTFDKVSEAKIVECINSLDEDNFFIILNNKEDFIQAAFSDGNFDIQYKENGKQFSAEKVLSKEATIQLFKDYYQGKDDWKKKLFGWTLVNQDNIDKADSDLNHVQIEINESAKGIMDWTIHLCPTRILV